MNAVTHLEYCINYVNALKEKIGDNKTINKEIKNATEIMEDSIDDIIDYIVIRNKSPTIMEVIKKALKTKT